MQFEEQVEKGKLKEGSSLCESCSHAQIVQGYAESQRRVWCTYGRWDHPEPMRFAVKDCSEYLGREQTTLRQMEKMAWSLPSKNSVSTPGFLHSTSSEETDE
jgi:hypothetical protein